MGEPRPDKQLLIAACEVAAVVSGNTFGGDPQLWLDLRDRVKAAAALPYTAEDVAELQQTVDILRGAMDALYLAVPAQHKGGLAERIGRLSAHASRLAQSLGGGNGPVA